MEDYVNDNIYNKEKALTYFKDIYDNGLNIKNNITMENIDKIYLDYCKKYMTLFGNYAVYERQDIITAYKYLQEQMKYKNKTKTNISILNSLIKSYEELTNKIGEYRFNIHSENQNTQNISNREMLTDVSMFKPILYKVIIDINNYILENENNDLIENIIKLKDDLDMQCLHLHLKENDYFKIWNKVYIDKIHNDKYNIQSLGKAKNTWKKEKNKSLKLILDFYKELVNIEKNISKETYNELKKEYEDKYKDIKNGKYYYSYLSQDEIHSSSLDNKIRKLSLKQNSNIL